MEIPVYIMLGLTSVVGLAFIVERGLALRWGKVVPPDITGALAACKSRDDVMALSQVCEQKPSPLGRLLLLAADHLDWPKPDNVDALQTAARQNRPARTRLGGARNHRRHRAVARAGRHSRA